MDALIHVVLFVVSVVVACASFVASGWLFAVGFCWYSGICL